MPERADIGLIGLGVMGANLARNIAGHGFTVAVHDADSSRISPMILGEHGEAFTPCYSPKSLMVAIRPPRPVIMLVPAGDAIDELMGELEPHLSPGDILIDAGNSDFRDTERRTAALEEKGLAFLGLGISGGAEGARTGPAIMAGGSPAVWDRVAPVMEAIAARHGDEPCAAWLGTGGAGHFVKTVHNGIEYADMQMIAEVYGILRDGLGLSPGEIAEVFEEWAAGPLASYLVDITAVVARATEPETGEPMLDLIRDVAGQKGTGRWSVAEAQRLGVVASTIEAAVAARELSADAGLRAAMAGQAPARLPGGAGDWVDSLRDALMAGKLIAYAQGFLLLARASAERGWKLDLPAIARTWRAGCIIRAGVLDDMARALADEPALLLADQTLRRRIDEALPGLRRICAAAMGVGLPVPSLSAALGYRDQLAAPRGTANLLQALRDCFGQHGFERTDMAGYGHHGPW